MRVGHTLQVANNRQAKLVDVKADDGADILECCRRLRDRLNRGVIDFESLEDVTFNLNLPSPPKRPRRNKGERYYVGDFSEDIYGGQCRADTTRALDLSL